MPVMPCRSKNKKGMKYGEGGHCYTGSGAETKAKKQGRAIAISKARAAGHRIPKK